LLKFKVYNTILKKNIYNIDKTSVILLMLSLVKVLIGKDNMQNYRGAYIKRIKVTAIKCISSNSRYLNPIII